MKKSCSIILFASIFAFFGISTHAQTVSNVVCRQDGQVIVVNYDIDQYAPKVDLYVSTDGGQNYVGPLRYVSGDIAEVKPGTKTIRWDVLSEYDSFSGNNIVFEVRPKNAENSAQMLYIAKSPKKSKYIAPDVLYKKSKNLRTWGIVLTSVGCGCIVAGGVTAIIFKNGWLIADGAILSVPFLGAGIPMWVVGDKRMKQSKALTYAPAFEYPINIGKASLIPSLGITNDRITNNSTLSAGLALRF